jgi:hypothetical protein
MAVLTLTATQDCQVEVRVRDKKGNPAQVQNPVWSSSEPGTATVTVDAANPLKAVVSAVGPVDEASLIQFDADADLGDGVKPIIATLDLVVTSGEATVVEITAGTPTEQP